MSDGTSIEWADATWTVAVGCTRVSDGCTPREDLDVMAAVEDWQRLVDDARREGLVPA